MRMISFKQCAVIRRSVAIAFLFILHTQLILDRCFVKADDVAYDVQDEIGDIHYNTTSSDNITDNADDDYFDANSTTPPRTISYDTYGVEAWLCEMELENRGGRKLPKVIDLSEGITQGSVVTVCIAPDDLSYANGIVISNMVDFTWYRDDLNVKQPSIENNMAYGDFMTIYEPGNCHMAEWCSFTTLLYAELFLNEGMLRGEGSAILAYDEDRRLGGYSNRNMRGLFQEASIMTTNNSFPTDVANFEVTVGATIFKPVGIVTLITDYPTITPSPTETPTFYLPPGNYDVALGSYEYIDDDFFAHQGKIEAKLPSEQDEPVQTRPPILLLPIYVGLGCSSVLIGLVLVLRWCRNRRGVGSNYVGDSDGFITTHKTTLSKSTEIVSSVVEHSAYTVSSDADDADLIEIVDDSDDDEEICQKTVDFAGRIVERTNSGGIKSQPCPGDLPMRNSNAMEMLFFQNLGFHEEDRQPGKGWKATIR